jgi:hypothetical protein
MKKSRLAPLLTALAVTTTLSVPLAASSHREAPLIAEDQTMDNTDVYVFRSPDNPDTVTIIANFIPFQEAAGGPNFHFFSPTGVYEIHIDNNGDAKEDITYQFRFRTDLRTNQTWLYNTGPVTTIDDADLNFRQFYTVNRITGTRRGGALTSLGSNFQVAPANIGPKSTPDYAALAGAAVFNLPNSGGKVFAGPRDDPFFVDLGSVFDLGTLRPIQQLHQVPPMRSSEPGVDGLKGYNVHSIALQIPIAQLTSNGQVPSGPTASNAIIGVWSTSSRGRVNIRAGGRPVSSVSGLTQVSRLGMPLVNEVVLSYKFKDLFNSLEPSADAGVFTSNSEFANRVLDPELAKLYKVLYNVDTPAAPRNDLVSVFLTGVDGLNKPANVVPAEMIRLNVAIPPAAQPNRLGVIGGDTAGFPNGRRLADDVTDVALRVVAGVLVPAFNKSPNNALTDGVDANDKPFLSSFPYVALPHQGFESRPHAN